MGEGKTCTKCGEFRTYLNFHKRKASHDGYRSACKVCTNMQNSKYREENPEKVKQANNEYRTKNREHIRQKGAEYRSEHLEECRRRSRDSAQLNRTDRLVAKRNYYIANKSEISRKAREYRKRFPERNTLKEQRRRARKKELTSDFRLEQWEYAVQFFEGGCCYCGETPKVLHQEHFVPLIKKGGYTVSNIVPSCADCNLSKKTKDFSEWYFTKENHTVKRATKIFEYFKIACKEAI